MSPAAYPTATRPSRRSLGILWFAIAAFGYFCAAIFAAWAWSPRVPYADQWRHYTHLLTEPLPASLFEIDNGHAEVLPNLLRLLDLRSCGGQESLQLVCGIALALVAAALFLLTIWRDRTLDCDRRAACAFAAVFGVFWLGNLRALTQPSDSVHVYLVLSCLAAALTSVMRTTPGAMTFSRDLIVASLFCIVASFSFGSGIATFVALIALMLARRDRLPRLLMPLVALLVSLGLYAMLAGTGSRPALAALPSVFIAGLRLFGTPIMYLFWPLLDPAAAAAAPAGGREIALTIANVWTAHFGDIRRAVFPQAAFGAAGIVLSLTIGLRMRRSASPPTRSGCLGFALAWFGIAVAMLIALAREDYFLVHPDQIFAARYLPWSCLGWAGLLIAQIAQARRSRIAFGIALLLPLLALPAEIGMNLLAKHVREVAEDTALYAAVGVLPPATPLGETDLDDLHTALPVLRDAHTAMFAWPQASLLDSPLSDPVTAAGVVALEASAVVVTPVANRLGENGSAVAVQFMQACTDARALVVADGQVIGLLRFATDGWHGTARGQQRADALQFFAACP